MNIKGSLCHKAGHLVLGGADDHGNVPAAVVHLIACGKVRRQMDVIRHGSKGHEVHLLFAAHQGLAEHVSLRHRRCHQLRTGHLQQLFAFLRLYAQLMQEHLGIGCRLLLGQDAYRHRTGNGNSLLKESLCLGHMDQMIDLSTAAGFSVNGHIVRITAKGCNILFYPGKGQDQIQLSGISGIPEPVTEISQIKIPPEMQSVVKAHHHHILLPAKAVCAHTDGAGVGSISAAVDVKEHRPLSVINARSEHV